VKILALALIFLMQLPSFAMLADTDICPVHGPGCAHGRECPAALTMVQDEPHSGCPSGGHGEGQARMKKYRCALTSCHGEAMMDGGLDAPFIVDNGSEQAFAGLAAAFVLGNTGVEDLLAVEVLEPPEAFLLS